MACGMAAAGGALVAQVHFPCVKSQEPVCTRRRLSYVNLTPAVDSPTLCSWVGDGPTRPRPRIAFQTPIVKGTPVPAPDSYCPDQLARLIDTLRASQLMDMLDSAETRRLAALDGILVDAPVAWAMARLRLLPAVICTRRAGSARRP